MGGHPVEFSVGVGGVWPVGDDSTVDDELAGDDGTVVVVPASDVPASDVPDSDVVVGDVVSACPWFSGSQPAVSTIAIRSAIVPGSCRRDAARFGSIGSPPPLL